VLRGDVLHHAVQHGCPRSEILLGEDLKGEIEHLGDLVARLGRDEDHRRPRHPLHVPLHLVAEVVFPGLGPLEIPLVDADDQPPPFFLGEGGDLEILVHRRLGGVEHQHRDVRVLDGSHRPQHRELLDPLADGRLPADARGVGEDDRAALVREGAVDGISGGARHRADDDPILPEQGVDQRRLADVGAPDDGDAHGAVGILGGGVDRRHRLLQLGELGRHRLAQGLESFIVLGGDSKGLAQAQRVELGHHRLGGAVAVDLVDHQQHRALGFTQELGDLEVAGGEASAGVAHEEDDLALLYRGLGLEAHVVGERIFLGVRHEAAGVHHGDLAPLELGVGIVAVPGHPGHVLDDGLPALHQPVEQRRLPHVGPADDGDERAPHRVRSST